jgi:hypothetical protein
MGWQLMHKIPHFEEPCGWGKEPRQQYQLDTSTKLVGSRRPEVIPALYQILSYEYNQGNGYASFILRYRNILQLMLIFFINGKFSNSSYFLENFLIVMKVQSMIDR